MRGLASDDLGKIHEFIYIKLILALAQVAGARVTWIHIYVCSSWCAVVVLRAACLAKCRMGERPGVILRKSARAYKEHGRAAPFSQQYAASKVNLGRCQVYFQPSCILWMYFIWNDHRAATDFTVAANSAPHQGRASVHTMRDKLDRNYFPTAQLAQTGQFYAAIHENRVKSAWLLSIMVRNGVISAVVVLLTCSPNMKFLFHTNSHFWSFMRLKGSNNCNHQVKISFEIKTNVIYFQW